MQANCSRFRWDMSVPETQCKGIILSSRISIYNYPLYARATADSSFCPDASILQPMRASKSQPTALAAHPPAVRPLSSADEAGPVTKKLRSSVRQRTAPPSSNAADSNVILKPSKSAGTLLAGADDRSKSSKARARPALTIANIFSSSGRAQTAATSSRLHAAGTAISKHSREQQPAAGPGTRRSTRLNSGTNNKPAATKVSTLLANVRNQAHLRHIPCL